MQAIECLDRALMAQGVEIMAEYMRQHSIT